MSGEQKVTHPERWDVHPRQPSEATIRAQAWERFASAVMPRMVAEFGPESCDLAAMYAARHADAMMKEWSHRFGGEFW